MNRSLFVLTSLVTIHAMSGQLKPIAFATSDHAIRAITETGPSFLQTRQRRYEVKYPGGMAAKGQIYVLWDSATGNFVWEYMQLHGPLPTEAAMDMSARFASGEFVTYSGPEALATFSVMNPNVYVILSTAKAAGLDDAEGQAFREATAHLGEIADGSFQKRVKLISLRSLGNDFLNPTRMSACCPPLKILGISHPGSKWELILGTEWKEKVIVDEKFDIVSHSRVQ